MIRLYFKRRELKRKIQIAHEAAEANRVRYKDAVRRGDKRMQGYYHKRLCMYRGEVMAISSELNDASLCHINKLKCTP